MCRRPPPATAPPVPVSEAPKTEALPGLAPPSAGPGSEDPVDLSRLHYGVKDYVNICVETTSESDYRLKSDRARFLWTLIQLKATTTRIDGNLNFDFLTGQYGPEEDARAILRDDHKLAKDRDDSAAASAAAADLDAQAQSRRIYFSALSPIWNSLVAGPAPFF